MNASTTAVIVTLAASLLLVGCAGPTPTVQDPPNAYAAWDRGPSTDSDFFPIGVWLQQPRNAEAYKAAGINLYVGLHQGPTEMQLAELAAAGMPVICAQNGTALANLDNPIIVGWMHGDEPDIAQKVGEKDGKPVWGPPIPPAEIVAAYEKIKANDPTRPVLVNLSRGVAVEDWPGRGARTGHTEDYPAYAAGADIVSFDVYPVSAKEPEVAGALWYVAKGVSKLIEATDEDQIVWNCIEASPISSPATVPTGEQIRAEVWMSIIHGSRGLIYFVHQFAPSFNDAYPLSDPTMLEAVSAINKQVHELAPVINSPAADDVFTAASSSEEVPIAAMCKRYRGAWYVFAVTMRDGEASGAFIIDGLGDATVEVIGENRTIQATDGLFTDDFGGYQVHLYKITP